MTLSVSSTEEQEQEERRCQGITNEGEPCRAPSEMIMADGYCLRHSPDPAKKEFARSASYRGGARTAARNRRGISPDELGALKSPEDVQRWAEVSARATASGQLPASTAQAIRSLLAQWLSAYNAGEAMGEVMRRLELLEAEARRTAVGAVR
jgi:hypothetical protein